jgi:hypothetical protein
MRTTQKGLFAVGIMALACSIATAHGAITNDLDVTPHLFWSFESYTNMHDIANGEDVVDGITNTWYGETEALVVSNMTYTPPTAGYPLTGSTHANVAMLNANVSNLVTCGPGKTVWIDHLIEPRRWDQEGHPTDIPADAQMAYYVNTNGNLVIFHHLSDSFANSLANLGNMWTEIDLPEAVESNTWNRTSIEMNYFSADGAYHYFRLLLNGTPVTSSNAFVKPFLLASQGSDFDYSFGGSYFPMGFDTNAPVVDSTPGNINAVLLQGTGKFDDFVISTNAPDFEKAYPIVASVEEGGTHGNINPSGTVMVPDGSNQTFVVTVTDSNYWSITEVEIVEDNATNNVAGLMTNEYTYTFNTVSNEGSIKAWIEADTTNGVPVWWMADFGLEGQNPTNNPDGDALNTKEEWLASTHPTNASLFSVTRTYQANGSNYIEWICVGVDPELPAIDVLKSTDLTNGFSKVGSVARSEGTNTWGETAPATEAFYRITATNSP